MKKSLKKTDKKRPISKKQKQTLLARKMSSTYKNTASLNAPNATPRADAVLSRLAELRTLQRPAVDRSSERPHQPSQLPPPAVVPLKKPRAERVAFLSSAADCAEQDSGLSRPPTAATCGKKKRRKLKLVKKRHRRQDEKGAAESGEAKLESARFRYLNEQLYTHTGLEALRMFSQDHDAFQAYHQGFRNQVAKWPVNPLDLIIENVNRMPPSHLVVDLGCGDARLATSVRQRVLSFDLVATNERVTACDMARVPVADGAANVVVLCLALMGTNLADFVTEANRVLRVGGQLRMAEVASRFESVDDFVAAMKEYGFSFISHDLTHQYFYLFSMKKAATVNRKRPDLPEITLKPCLYKRR